MRLIVGLGNPGEKYALTRHNIGFMVLDKLAKKLVSGSEIKWNFDHKAKAEILTIENPGIILVRPQTFMNASGQAVARILKYHEIKASDDLFIVHDDVDLPLGKVKIRLGGASAGHHGVESIIRELRSAEFTRIRLGIGRPRTGEIKSTKDVENYVLEGFGESERGELKKMVKKAVEALELIIEKDIASAMNKYN